MEFGDNFIKTIEKIYSNQTAKCIINGDITEQFNISKGTRQGCPLSPLLFILTLEILIREVRKNQEITGISIKDQEYKVQAFADDLAFILEDPVNSGTKLIKEIEKFGKVAGLKINKEKTKILVKNLTERQKKELENNMEIQIVKKIKYLGIQITSKCTTLKEDNYDKLIIQIKKDLEKWENLQLSLLGRIATIKMNVLPRIIYLFQTIPVKLKKSYFDQLNKITLKFIWQKKKARIKLKTLQQDKSVGGFGLPIWENYHKAATIAWVKDWVTLQNKRLLILEGHDLHLGWHAFLWYNKHKSHKYFQRHFIRDALLSTWLKIKKSYYIKVPLWISPLEAWTYPTVNNLDRIIRYKDILNANREMKSIQELKSQAIDLSWWAYNILQSNHNKDKATTGIATRNNELDVILISPGEKFIRKIYKYLLLHELEKQQFDNMEIWAKIFGYAVDPDDWQQIWDRNIKLTISVAYKENWYKLYYRWHYSPSQLAAMKKSNNSKCWKCKNKTGSYYHMWWRCPKARRYWIEIQQWLKELTNHTFELKPEIYLFGIFPQSLSKEITYLTLHVLTAARITYAQYWKSKELPNKAHRIAKLLECAEMNKLTMKIKGKGNTEYYNIWDSLYKWLDNRNRN